MRNRSYEQSGFSLTETLIAGGILATIAAFGMKLFDTQSRGQRQVEANFEIATTVQQIQTILSRQANCTETFLGQNVNSGSASKIRKSINSTFEDVYPVGGQLPNNIWLKGISLTRDFPGLPSNEGMVKLTFSRGKASVKEEASKHVRITFSKDASDNIVTCVALGEVVDTFWKQSPGDPLNIYYNLGSVAVGVPDPDPTAALQVDSTTKGFIGPRMTNAQRMAITTPAEGVMVYDLDEHAYYYWDGSMWVKMGGSDVLEWY